MSTNQQRENPAGYASRQYAESLSEWGQPIELSAAGGWLLRRPIRAGDQDAMACYPLFCCRDWGRLSEDLDQRRDELVSVALVTDPFGDYDEALLRAAFDRAMPFKEHFIADLNVPVNDLENKRHLKHARRSLQEATIEVPADPLTVLDDWVSVYQVLVERHQITGLRAFSPESFRRQLQTPGIVAFQARSTSSGELQGIHLWYQQGPVAYSHLSAYTPAGYENRIAYALNWKAHDYFSGRARWLMLGSGAGSGGASGGLVEFKRGWSTGTRTAWFCGKILQPTRYEEICRQQGATDTTYFPAYRQGEF